MQFNNFDCELKNAHHNKDIFFESKKQQDLNIKYPVLIKISKGSDKVTTFNWKSI